MTGRRWLIMGVLAVLTVVFSVQAARTWLQPFQERVAERPDARKRKAQAPPVVKQRKPPKSAYDVIAARSLFGQNRTEDVSDARIGNLKQAESSRYAKKIGLFGVVIDKGEKKALVNKDIGRRGTTDILWVRVGDRIERVKVIGIERDRIILQENGSHYEILLSDQHQPPKRSKPRRDKGPTVISTETQAVKKPAQKSEKPKIRVKPKVKDEQAKDDEVDD